MKQTATRLHQFCRAGRGTTLIGYASVWYLLAQREVSAVKKENSPTKLGWSVGLFRNSSGCRLTLGSVGRSLGDFGAAFVLNLAHDFFGFFHVSHRHLFAFGNDFLQFGRSKAFATA